MAYDLFHGAESLIDLSDSEALLSFSQPTLIHIKGQDSTVAVLISVLLHGCEPAGFRAFLKEINSKPTYAHDVYYLVGNVKSAQLEPYFTHRLVPGGENYNRTWVDDPKTEGEHQAKEIFDFLKTLPIKAHLDLHSFTAKNTAPHVICSNKESLDLARTFAEIVYLFEMPIGALIEQTKAWGPSCVVECGTNNSPEADEYAYTTLRKFLIECNVIAGENIKVATQVNANVHNIKIKPDVSVTWAEKPQEGFKLTFREDIGRLNHKFIQAGTPLGWTNSLHHLFTVKNKHGEVDPGELFEVKEGKLITKIDIVPNLMAANERIAKESGFYFFKRSNL